MNNKQTKSNKNKQGMKTMIVKIMKNKFKMISMRSKIFSKN